MNEIYITESACANGGIAGIAQAINDPSTTGSTHVRFVCAHGVPVIVEMAGNVMFLDEGAAAEAVAEAGDGVEVIDLILSPEDVRALCEGAFEKIKNAAIKIGSGMRVALKWLWDTGSRVWRVLFPKWTSVVPAYSGPGSYAASGYGAAHGSGATPLDTAAASTGEIDAVLSAELAHLEREYPDSPLPVRLREILIKRSEMQASNYKKVEELLLSADKALTLLASYYMVANSEDFSFEDRKLAQGVIDRAKSNYWRVRDKSHVTISGDVGERRWKIAATPKASVPNVFAPPSPPPPHSAPVGGAS